MCKCSVCVCVCVCVCMSDVYSHVKVSVMVYMCIYIRGELNSGDTALKLAFS